MAVFRVAKLSDFTTMSNHHLRNRSLSLKAVGLMSKILSLPDEWDYSLKGLATLNTDGIDGVRSAIKELEDAGYIVRRQLRDKNGRMSHSEYLVLRYQSWQDRHRIYRHWKSRCRLNRQRMLRYRGLQRN